MPPEEPPLPPLPADALARVAQAEEFGVPLSKGQATQAFADQEAEAALKAQSSPEGEKARAFVADQAGSIKEAVDRLKERFGDVTATAAERGQTVRAEIQNLRDQGAAGVSALYQQAERLAGSDLPLSTAGIKSAATDVLIDESVPEAVKRSIAQEMARYGLIGTAEPMNEVGLTRVKLDDGSSIQIRGEPKPLTVSNAETFRKAVNALYESDPTHKSQALKPAIDDAFEQAVEAAARRGGTEGAAGQAYQTARAAYRQQRQTFNAKDIVQSIVDTKKGTATDALLPEKIIAKILGDKDSVSDLKKVKAVLLSKLTETSPLAWKAIQAHGVASIFEKALTTNANLGGGVLSAVSGAKLRTAIQAFGGAPKLRVLLEPQDFNDLMKLSRVIGDATIPVSGTTNPSGTGGFLVRFMAKQGMRLGGIAAHALPGGGAVKALVEGAQGLIEQGRATTAAKATLEDMRAFTAEKAAEVSAPKAARPQVDAAAYFRQFVEIAGSDRLIAPLLAAQPKERSQ